MDVVVHAVSVLCCSVALFFCQEPLGPSVRDAFKGPRTIHNQCPAPYATRTPRSKARRASRAHAASVDVDVLGECFEALDERWGGDSWFGAGATGWSVGMSVCSGVGGGLRTRGTAGSVPLPVRSIVGMRVVVAPELRADLTSSLVRCVYVVCRTYVDEVYGAD